MKKSSLKAQFFILIGFTVAGVLYIDRRITKTDKCCSCEEKRDKPNTILENQSTAFIRTSTEKKNQIKNTIQPILKEEVKTKSNTPKVVEIKTKDSSNTNKGKIQSTDDWSKTWPRVNLKNCSQRVFMNRGINSPKNIKNSPYTETGIMSFPGSGNTWTRFLIEQATGLWTGSVYTDGGLYKGGFRGEMEDPALNSTVGVKDHGKAGRVHERVILVIRDPYRALLSEFNRRNSGGSHVKGANDSVLESETWEKYIRDWAAKSWSRSNIRHIKLYMNTSKLLGKDQNPFTAPPGHWERLLLVSYERLKKDAIVELDRIVKFLGLPVFRKHCLQENKKGNFRRPPKSTEKIACLYDKPVLKKTMDESKKYIFEEGRNMGAGNLLIEVKETYTIENNKTCIEDKAISVK